MCDLDPGVVVHLHLGEAAGPRRQVVRLCCRSVPLFVNLVKKVIIRAADFVLKFDQKKGTVFFPQIVIFREIIHYYANAKKRFLYPIFFLGSKSLELTETVSYVSLREESDGGFPRKDGLLCLLR